MKPLRLLEFDRAKCSRQLAKSENNTVMAVIYIIERKWIGDGLLSPDGTEYEYWNGTDWVSSDCIGAARVFKSIRQAEKKIAKLNAGITSWFGSEDWQLRVCAAPHAKH